MKRNWKLINSIVNTIAESDKDIFEVKDFKSAEVSEEEVKYTLKLMLDRGLVFDKTTCFSIGSPLSLVDISKILKPVSSP